MSSSNGASSARHPSQLWDKLVRSHPTITDVEIRKHARLLSGMLIVAVILLIMIMIMVGLLDRLDLVNPASIVGYVTIVVCAVLYVVNRAGHFRWARRLFIVYSTVTMILTPYIPGSAIGTVPFALTPVILVSIFYRGRLMYVITGSMLLSTFTLNQLHFGDDIYWSLQVDWYFLLFASGLIVVFVRHLHSLEMIRRENLQLANRKLRESEVMLEHRVDERTAELRVAYDKVEALNRVKDEFVSNVSHELRTPITSIKLQNFLIKQSATSQQEAYLDTLQRETNRLETLIESLLTLSRLDQQRVEFRFERINLNQIVREYVKDREAVAQDQKLQLVCIPHQVDVWVWGDQHLLGQVLSILLTNAFTYTSEGGQITVRTKIMSGPEQERLGCFSVNDTGIGIPPGEQDQLFARFFRGDSAHKQQVSGTGLGLSIAKAIVDQHHGTIEVESTGKVGEGAEFCVCLPVLDLASM